ncbi:MAG: cytochrome C peroxidase [Verrucomicrobia bacterium]|nr:cytochrome C peroxidase [Verrucomicrobiota bacterium]
MRAFASLAALVCAGLTVFPLHAAEPLVVELEPQWAGRPLTFAAEPTPARPSITRLDFLISEVAVRDARGIWVELPDAYEVIRARDGRRTLQLPGAPARVSALRFSVGLPPAVNTRSASGFAPGHPLHPEINGLHRGPAGFVFLAFEGQSRNAAGEARPFAYQLTGPELPTLVELTLPSTSGTSRVALDVSVLLRGLGDGPRRSDEPTDSRLRRNLPAAFAPIAPAPDANARAAMAQAESAPRPGVQRVALTVGTPYRLSVPAGFPTPQLPADNPLTEEGVELGKLLFFDRRLSGNGRQSCASCHRPELGFVDPAGRVSRGATGELGTRNSQPLHNLAWARTFFWDGRAATLREQVLQPIENPVEMHARLPDVLAFLRREPAYRSQFEAAFGPGEIDRDRLARALEQFLLTLTAAETRYDRAQRGGAPLSAEEQRGAQLFQTDYDPARGQQGAGCYRCHGGPTFRNQTFANNGLDTVPRDWGRALVTGQASDRGLFAVPSLRNVGRTAPYMHDGRFGTLEEVVAHYAGGVQRSATLDPFLARLPAGGVPLSADDQRALVAFLRTLTDETIPPRPPRPPEFRRDGPPGPGPGFGPDPALLARRGRPGPPPPFGDRGRPPRGGFRPPPPPPGESRPF